MSPSADLFLAAADLHRWLQIHRAGAPALQAEVSASRIVAVLLLALVALAIVLAMAVTSTRPPGRNRAPDPTSVSTDPPAPAGVVRMEYDPLR